MQQHASTKHRRVPRPSFCSPARFDAFKEHGTCFSAAELRALAESYNASIAKSTGKLRNVVRHTQHEAPIDLRSLDGMDDSESIQHLKRALSERLHPLQEHEWSDVLATPDKMYRQIQAALRPRVPRAWSRNSHQWLSTSDIEVVMQQYEDGYPHFKFVGVFPVDFDAKPSGIFGSCVADEMCGLSVKQLQRKRHTSFGAIINKDKHYESGSHWVALYACFDPSSKNFGVHYFDSIAQATPAPVKAFMRRIAKQIQDVTQTQAPQTANKVRLQFENTECGIFAMYFLACCISDVQRVEDIWKAMADDGIIHMLRNVFYRPQSTVIADH